MSKTFIRIPRAITEFRTVRKRIKLGLRPVFYPCPFPNTSRRICQNLTSPKISVAKAQGSPLVTQDTFKDIEKFEADLWEAADNLRANSKLTSSDYFMPVLGVIFLRHAANRFEVATKQIQEDQAAGRMPKRAPINADYVRRRALWLPERRVTTSSWTRPRPAAVIYPSL